MKEFLSNQNIKFLYLDISQNMLNIKTFLKYRDSAPEFIEIKKNGRVGLPCIVVNNGEQVIFDKELLNIEELRVK